MRRFAALLLGLALVLAGCSGTNLTGAGNGNDAGAAAAGRMIGVYSAVIRRLITVDHTFGSGQSPFDRVFIVDGVAADAGGPTAVPAGSVKPFSPEVKAGVIRELADLPPVEFVANPDSVVVGEKRCAHVKGNGVLITLGPISGGKDSVTVPNGLFFACLGGQWLTYELEHADGNWQATGTRGPIAIS